MTLTLSIIKADTGGFVGPSSVHPDMLAAADAALAGERGSLLIDFHVTSCGDDLALVMTHEHGPDATAIHQLAWSVFQETTEIARGLGLSFPHTVAGCMRGSHHAPLMPVPRAHAHPTRFDGPPRVMCLGFQVHEGRLIGPNDMFDDPAFDEARHQANVIMDYLRRHGPFEPHRLPLDELEYTTMPSVAARLADRWEPISPEVVDLTNHGR